MPPVVDACKRASPTTLFHWQRQLFRHGLQMLLSQRGDVIQVARSSLWNMASTFPYGALLSQKGNAKLPNDSILPPADGHWGSVGT